jgi:hypothetical protein
MLPVWFRNGCPVCGCPRRLRSHRRDIVERLIGVLFLPYRCLDRDHRFFKFRWLPAEPEKPLDASAQLEQPLPVAAVRRAS